MSSMEELRQTEEKIAVLLNACANASKHYENYQQSFATLDAKAQGVATVSGLVLAAIAAFSKDGRPPNLAYHGWWWAALVLAVPVLALAAVIVSMRGAFVSDIAEPFDASSSMLEARSVSERSGEQFSSNDVLAYYTLQLGHWRECLEGTKNSPAIKSSVKKKAHYVLIGQRLLMAALSLLTLLFGLVLFGTRVAGK